MEQNKGKKIGKYVKLAIATITVIISTRDNGKLLKDAIKELKN